MSSQTPSITATYVAPTPAQLPTATPHARLSEIERDAFAKGYEQGERAGAEAGGRRAEAMLRRMASTLEELAAVRQQMIQQAERQMVQIALTMDEFSQRAYGYPDQHALNFNTRAGCWSRSNACNQIR